MSWGESEDEYGSRMGAVLAFSSGTNREHRWFKTEDRHRRLGPETREQGRFPLTAKLD
jgi:hypothetical protein